jgi:acrylyl-CoA reductase (NADPH)
MATFRALVLNQADGDVRAAVQELDEASLPDGDVTLSVEWSSLNYKDGMILLGQGRLVRDYPHVPGVDLAGTVEASASDRFSPGDRVVLTGWRVGEIWWGGFAERARVKSEWLVRLPDGLSTRTAMGLGTAGFTSMMAVAALEDHGLAPSDRPVLVTGAAGGVGSVAVHLLARLGHHVVAATGRPEHHEWLGALGAREFVARDELASLPARPLLSERWAGCVDPVGGDTLAHVLAEMSYGSSVAACGLAGGNQLNTTVVPFLLRAVNLLGIDSVACPTPRREQLWRRLAEVVDGGALEELITEATLDELPRLAPDILAGRIRGRVVVRTRA